MSTLQNRHTQRPGTCATPWHLNYAPVLRPGTCATHLCYALAPVPH